MRHRLAARPANPTQFIVFGQHIYSLPLKRRWCTVLYTGWPNVFLCQVCPTLGHKTGTGYRFLGKLEAKWNSRANICLCLAVSFIKASRSNYYLSLDNGLNVTEILSKTKPIRLFLRDGGINKETKNEIETPIKQTNCWSTFIEIIVIYSNQTLSICIFILDLYSHRLLYVRRDWLWWRCFPDE